MGGVLQGVVALPSGPYPGLMQPMLQNTPSTLDDDGTTSPRKGNALRTSGSRDSPRYGIQTSPGY